MCLVLKKVVFEYWTETESVFAVSSYFFENIEAGLTDRSNVGYAMNAITGSTDTIIVPVHHPPSGGKHWTVAAIYQKTKCMVHTNSLRDAGASLQVFRTLLPFIKFTVKVNGGNFGHGEWTLISLQHLPLQQEGINFSVYACINGQNLMLQDPIDITHCFLNEFRYWVTLKLLSNERRIGGSCELIPSTQVNEHNFSKHNAIFRVAPYKVSINKNVPGYSKTDHFFKLLKTHVQSKLNAMETSEQKIKDESI